MTTESGPIEAYDPEGEACPLALRTVILASASGSRARMLREVGVAFEAVAAGVDEEETKISLRNERARSEEIAEVLAELKAAAVSRRRAGMLVIGADQVLECDGEQFDKPPDRDDAERQLRALRGREHRLVTCAAICRDGQRVWHHLATARLVMRRFSDEFVERYLDAIGDAALTGPGAYQIEGPGVHLFSRIDGDHYAIRGLPMIPLLDYLRVHEALRT